MVDSSFGSNSELELDKSETHIHIHRIKPEILDKKNVISSVNETPEEKVKRIKATEKPRELK